MKHFETAGKFFLRQGCPFEVKGVTYGPFGPSGPLGAAAGLNAGLQLERDLELITGMGLNTIRTYELPSREELDLLADHGVSVLVTVPWSSHVDFFQDSAARESGREAVRRAAGELGDHAALFGLIVGNEIDSPLVRWMGERRVQYYLEDLVDLGRELSPETLFSYASYPSTEWLAVRNVDFVTFNVFLEEEAALRRYLRRLHLVAGDKPLVIGEFGLDSLSNGEARQEEVLSWGIRVIREVGCGGGVVFAFSDAWYRGGREVEDWAFGLVDRERNPKPAAGAVQQAFAEPVGVGAEREPAISVICCTHNGADRIGACLDSLVALDYPDYEVLVIDDGSCDGTRSVVDQFVERHRQVRLVTQAHAGLGVARNRGAELAGGEILAFIDDDARADARWLRFLAMAYEDGSGHVAVGGPNIFPQASTWEELCVALAPGRPYHVMLDDVCAEHIPGVNLSVRREAFFAVGGFDPRFEQAGDDVDFCWRLIDMGWTIGFTSGAMVWHSPRRTFKAYFRQQCGYGRAEAMLAGKHRLRFERFLGIRWRGCIYGPSSLQQVGRGSGTMIYRGIFAMAGFQAVYGNSGGIWAALAGSPSSLAVAMLGCLVGFLWPTAWVLAGGLLSVNLWLALRWAFRVRMGAAQIGWRVRGGVAFLHVAQWLVRGGARIWGGVFELSARP